jgi:hypothetical protein
MICGSEIFIRGTSYTTVIDGWDCIANARFSVVTHVM